MPKFVFFEVEICRFGVQNVKLGKIWPRRFNGLKKMKLEPKFEVSISKNKETGQQSGYQKIWKIAPKEKFLGQSLFDQREPNCLVLSGWTYDKFDFSEKRKHKTDHNIT